MSAREYSFCKTDFMNKTIYLKKKKIERYFQKNKKRKIKTKQKTHFKEYETQNKQKTNKKLASC